MLRVQLFGRGQAWYEGQAIAGFPGLQCFRLLCYLLLNRGHAHPRERLAAVFWAEYPTSASRTYLRNCLWRLREALGGTGAPADDCLLCEDGNLSFAESVPHWLYVAAFKDSVYSVGERGPFALQGGRAFMSIPRDRPMAADSLHYSALHKE